MRRAITPSKSPSAEAFEVFENGANGIAIYGVPGDSDPSPMNNLIKGCTIGVWEGQSARAFAQRWAWDLSAKRLRQYNSR